MIQQSIRIGHRIPPARRAQIAPQSTPAELYISWTEQAKWSRIDKLANYRREMIWKNRDDCQQQLVFLSKLTNLSYIH